MSDDVSATITWAKRLVDEATAMNARVGVDHVRGPLDGRHRCTRRTVRGDVRRGRLGHGDRVEPTRAGTDHSGGIGHGRGGGHRRAGLVIDSWNFSFGDDGWDDLAEVPWSGSRTCSSLTRCPPPRPTEWTRRSIAAPCPETACWNSTGSRPHCGNADSTASVSVQVLSAEFASAPLPDFARLAHERRRATGRTDVRF